MTLLAFSWVPFFPVEMKSYWHTVIRHIPDILCVLLPYTVFFCLLRFYNQEQIQHLWHGKAGRYVIICTYPSLSWSASFVEHLFLAIKLFYLKGLFTKWKLCKFHVPIIFPQKGVLVIQIWKLQKVMAFQTTEKKMDWFIWHLTPDYTSHRDNIFCRFWEF